jgi:hypothetical protein
VEKKRARRGSTGALVGKILSQPPPPPRALIVGIICKPVSKIFKKKTNSTLIQYFICKQVSTFEKEKHSFNTDSIFLGLFIYYLIAFSIHIIFVIPLSLYISFFLI